MSVVPFAPRNSGSVPAALAAEQALIGACLHDPRAFDVATEHVRVEDFFEEAHRRIWWTLAGLRSDGRTLDIRLVAAALGETAASKIDGLDCTVGQYIARLAAEATSVADAGDFARAIKDASDCRRMMAAANELQASVSQGITVDPVRAAADAIEQLDAVVQSRSRTATPRIAIGDAAVKAIEAARQLAEGNRRRGVTTGLIDLDRITLGLREGKMYVVAGRPGMGKTMLALSIAIAAAKSGVGVYFVSLEMDDAEMSERAISSEAYIMGHEVTYQDIASWQFGREHDRALERALERMKMLPLVIEQEPGLTMGQIRARARQVRIQMEARGVKLGLIITDHMGLIRASSDYRGNKVAETGEISNAHKAMAKEFGIPVVALCQLNREVETREDKRPGLADLRWSGEIEQDADCVIFPFREAYYIEREKNQTPDQACRLLDVQNIMEIHVAKNRGGSTGHFDAFCHPGCNVVRNLMRRQ